jgi:bifunctional non-homologous end joining protein LigD
MIVRRDGETVRIYSRRGNDWTARLPTIAAAATRIKGRSFTLDGGAVVIGADGLSRFDELRRVEGARVAFLYAFDFLEHDGDDLREQPLLARRKALARLLRRSQEGIVFNEHTEEEGALVFDQPASSAPRASSRSASTRPIGPGRTPHGSKFATPPASLCSGSGARIGTSELVRGQET